MTAMWNVIYAWFQSALTGMGSPSAIFFALVITTFLLEDVAIAAGVALAIDGSLGWGLSFMAVAGGIAVGDLGLYALGRLSHKVAWIKNRYVNGRQFKARELMMSKLGSTIMLARAIPGFRLLTYVACGYLHVPLSPFAAWVALSVTIWTVALFAISAFFGHQITEITGIPSSWTAPTVVVVIALLIPVFKRIFIK
jgi:membrane protein DedA with SNARE-associated domain